MPSPTIVLSIPNIVTHRSHVCAQGDPDAEEPEAPEPCEPDRGVPEEAEAAPSVRVLRPHRPQRAGEVSQGGPHAAHKGEGGSRSSKNIALNYDQPMNKFVHEFYLKFKECE